MEQQRRVSTGDLQSITIIILVLVVVGLVIRMNNLNRSVEVVAVAEQMVEAHPTRDSIRLTQFDPNTATLSDLRSLGLSNVEALSIIRYREFIRNFRIKEELVSCYDISDSLYFVLEPYIIIGEEFRYQKPTYDTYGSSTTTRTLPTLLTPSKFLIDTVGVEYLTSIGALTPRQAEVFVRWRDMSGIHSEEELRGCYVVSDSIARWLMRYVIFSPRTPNRVDIEEPVDLNRADSATLRSVRGIGERSVVAILEYRQRLGGFYSVEQLTDIDIISESNYEKIITQIFADSCDISKIDINFALAKELSEHPYISPRLRKLLKKRQLKGGWSRIEEMIEDNIFTHEEAQRVRPYLLFEH